MQKSSIKLIMKRKKRSSRNLDDKEVKKMLNFSRKLTNFERIFFSNVQIFNDFYFESFNNIMFKIFMTFWQKYIVWKTQTNSNQITKYTHFSSERRRDLKTKKNVIKTNVTMWQCERQSSKTIFNEKLFYFIHMIVVSCFAM